MLELMEKSIGFFGKISGSLTNPEGFFSSVKTETGIFKSLIYFAVLSLIGVFVKFLGIALNIQLLLQTKGMLTYADVLSSYAGSFVLLFIGIGIFHIFVRLFGGQGGFAETFKANVYGNTPSFLFGWIPYVGVLGILYGIYLFIKGLSVLHGMTMGKAFLAFLIPVLILVVLFVIAIALIGATIIGILLGKGGVLSQLPGTQITGNLVKVVSRIT